MSTTSRGRRQRRDFKTWSIILLQLLIVINCAKAIDYAAYRRDVVSPGITRDSARTTRGLLEELNLRNISKIPNLQDGTEHLLHYGALLRGQILDTFGRLVYEKYDDFSMPEIEALYRIYRETLERRYNIFDIVPKILEDPDTRPTKICFHINRNVRTCLKEISQDCMNVRIHDEPHNDTLSKPALNVTREIYLLAEIPKNYPEGFSLNAVLDLLHQSRRPHLRITPGLFSGLLHNIRYDNFDDGVRTAEREIVSFLANKSKDFPSINEKFVENPRSVSQLLKNYLTNKKYFYGNVAKHAAYLAEHVLREVDAVDENIELLGTIYDNSTINLGYLFELILPNDTVDLDIAEARDYLLHKIREKNIVEKYLRIEKYQQAGPDQLIMEIFGQLRDIGFAVDIVTSLHAHARFWHRSHMIENLNDLLELFDAYDNLRGLPNFSGLIKAANQIKNNLQDSKNVTVELLCTRPRACLRIGLELVFKCATVNDETKKAIKTFLEETACNCSPLENFSKKQQNDIGIKMTTEVPQEIVKMDTKNAKAFDKNPDEKQFHDIKTNLTAKTPQKIGIEIDDSSASSDETIHTTAKTPQKIEIETDDSSASSDKTIQLNHPTLMNHITESFETWRNIYDFDFEDNYSNSDEMEESDDRKGKILRDNEKSTAKSCVGKDCLSNQCNGTECIEVGMNCTGDCVDCSDDDCIQPGNCTGCAKGNSKNNCTGNDCSENTEKVVRDCEGLKCIKNSTEIDGSAINCEDGNCTESIKCKGDNCRNNSTAEISCEGSDCIDDSEKIPRLSLDKNQCQGSNCSAVDCTGNDCIANATLVPCKGPQCPNNSITQNCTGLDCPSINCTGKNCSIRETTGCEGKDCSKNFENCTGNDCVRLKNGKNCTGPNCTSKEVAEICEGDNCFFKQYQGDNCKGSNCSDGQSMQSDCDGESCEDYDIKNKCKGSNCTQSSMEICEGLDCDWSEEKNDSEDTDCSDEENENDCTGPNCSINEKQITIDCKGNDCIKEEKKIESCSGKNCPILVEPQIKEKIPSDNITDILVPVIVKGEVKIESCPGKNCSTNVETPTGGKKKSEESTDLSRPPIAKLPIDENEGLKNSSLVKGEVETEKCIDKNCSNSDDRLIGEKEKSVNFTVSSYAVTEVETESCPGKNCSINIEQLMNEKLPMDNSTDFSIPSLVEKKVEMENCTDKNCSINIESPMKKNMPTENSTDSVKPNENSTNTSISLSPSTTNLVANRTIFCDNGNVYYRRKLNRLRKMRRIFGNSSKNRAKAWEAISTSSNIGREKNENNEKTDFNQFRRSQRNNFGILRALVGSRENNDTSSLYEILKTTERTKIEKSGNNVRNKIDNQISEEDSNLRKKKIRKKMRKYRVGTGGKRKERVGIKSSIEEDNIGDEDENEILIKRKEDGEKTKKLREKLKKIRGGRYRIKTTLVKDDDYEDDEEEESSDDLSLEEILTQRLREEMKKLRKDFRTNSTKRGKIFRVRRKLEDRDLEDSRDSGSKDFSIYRKTSRRNKRISELRNQNRETDVESVPIVGKMESQKGSFDDQDDRKLRKYIFAMPSRIRKRKYRIKKLISKNNEFN